jgi:hypothetical protein
MPPARRAGKLAFAIGRCPACDTPAPARLKGLTESCR